MGAEAGRQKHAAAVVSEAKVCSVDMDEMSLADED